MTIDKPAGVINGDVMLAGISDTYGQSPITAPSGWVLVRTLTDSYRTSIYRKTAGYGEPASYTWTITDVRRIAGGIVAFSGVDNATPIQVENGTVEGASATTNHATPAITTSGSSTWLVSIFSDRRDAGAFSTWTPPSGTTERVDTHSTNGTDTNVALAIYTVGPVSAGSKTHTAVASGSSDKACMEIVALKAATTNIYGCSASLEERAYALATAGRVLAAALKAGETLPSTYTIAGSAWPVVKANITPDGVTNNRAALDAAFSASRSGVNTILVVPPSELHYRYNDILNLSANTHVVAYGATFEPLGVTKYATVFGGNDASVLGLRMIGHHSTLSKWVERFEDNPAAEPAKNGTVSISNGGGVTNDAWFVTTNRSNVIVMDNIANGSLTGLVRAWGSSTEHLYENNVMRRSHSDSIHLANNATFMTVRRNRIFDSGDDAISVVSYDKAGNPPGNILVELNEVRGSRGRGITVVGGFEVLHQDNYVEWTNLAPFLYAAASSHNTHNVRAICRRNRIYRGGQREANHTHNGIAVATFDYSGATVIIDVMDNECNTYLEWYASGANFVRVPGSATGITVTATGNIVRAINSVE